MNEPDVVSACDIMTAPATTHSILRAMGDLQDRVASFRRSEITGIIASATRRGTVADASLDLRAVWCDGSLDPPVGAEGETKGAVRRRGAIAGIGADRRHDRAGAYRDNDVAISVIAEGAAATADVGVGRQQHGLDNWPGPFPWQDLTGADSGAEHGGGSKQFTATCVLCGLFRLVFQPLPLVLVMVADRKDSPHV